MFIYCTELKCLYSWLLSLLYVKIENYFKKYIYFCSDQVYLWENYSYHYYYTAVVQSMSYLSPSQIFVCQICIFLQFKGARFAFVFYIGSALLSGCKRQADHYHPFSWLIRSLSETLQLKLQCRTQSQECCVTGFRWFTCPGCMVGIQSVCRVILACGHRFHQY